MLDFTHLEKYKENNRIEAKKALGGLPKSIWETYSAFANTLGGVILLGVEEFPDKTLHAVNLPDPIALIKEFWDSVNNPQKVSVNILSDKHVYVEQVDDCDIIVIEIPRAQRYDKPIFIDGNPLTGTYRRNGEGDYKCTKEEVQSMLRDAAMKSQDMMILENMNLDVFDYESLRRYRMRMRLHRPGHVWETLDDIEFLHRLEAVGRSENGELHPTAAGLLMFGYEYEIVKEYPHYFLDYREQMEEELRWTDRFVSSSGDWSGNLFDFYFKVYYRLAEDIKVPFAMKDGVRVDDTEIHGALREALANCIINADYYGRRGLVIIKKKDEITISNPGGFRIELAAAKSGGISDPRNTGLMKMFNLINIGERAGSGIPNIFQAWKNYGWRNPLIVEEFSPERITLCLSTSARISGDKKAAIKSGDKREGRNCAKTELQKEAVISYLTDNVTAKSAELADMLGVKASRIKVILGDMVKEDIIVAEGGNRNRRYKLKA